MRAVSILDMCMLKVTKTQNESKKEKLNVRTEEDILCTLALKIKANLDSFMSVLLGTWMLSFTVQSK